MGADAPINRADADAAYEAAVDGTVGLEQEYQILDPQTLDLVPRFEDLEAAASDDPILSESIAGELIRTEIEIRSGKGDDVAHAVALQDERRKKLFSLAESQGVLLGSTGTHPWDDYREQSFIDTEHYQRVVDGLRWIARRNTTFSLHVHIGVNGGERAIAVCDRLREVLPSLLAISANSPFVDGIDTGLHSIRSQTFTKTFPRCGIPDHYGSWETYWDYLDRLTGTNSIVEYTQVWWSIRPHIAFGTVEVRICDPQTTAQESDALSELVVACARQALRDHDEKKPFEPLPGRFVEENFWRAIRDGQDAKLIDWTTNSEYEAAEATERLLQWTAPVRSELGIEPKLPELNGAQRQRAAIAGGASIKEAFAETVNETMASSRA